MLCHGCSPRIRILQKSWLTLSHIKVFEIKLALLHCLLCPAGDQMLDVGGVVYVRPSPLCLATRSHQQP